MPKPPSILEQADTRDLENEAFLQRVRDFSELGPGDRMMVQFATFRIENDTLIVRADGADLRMPLINLE